MTFWEFFHDYWWLIFPIFGLGMAVWGMASSESQSKRVMDLIKSYVDQGKDPPPELLRMAAEGGEASGPQTQQSRQQSSGWSFVVFAALAAGFGVGYWLVRGESFAFALLIVAVFTAVMALGSLVLLLLGRK
jgi:hypothetical protein